MAGWSHTNLATRGTGVAKSCLENWGVAQANLRRFVQIDIDMSEATRNDSDVVFRLRFLCCTSYRIGEPEHSKRPKVMALSLVLALSDSSTTF